MEGNISSREVGGDFGGHHAGIGACYIDVGIKITGEGVDDFFPISNFLHLI